MADKRYSIDDILNEYPKTDGSGSKPDLDELLGSYEDKKQEKGFSTEKVTLHNTDIFERPVTPDLSDIKIELTGNIPVSQPESAAQKKPHTIKQSSPSAVKTEEEEENQQKQMRMKRVKIKQRQIEEEEDEERWRERRRRRYRRR